MTTPDPFIESVTEAYLGRKRPKDCPWRSERHSIFCYECDWYDTWEREYKQIARIAPLVQNGLQKQLDDYVKGGEWCRNQRHGQLCELFRNWQRAKVQLNHYYGKAGFVEEYRKALAQFEVCEHELLRYRLERPDGCSPCN